MWSSRACLNFLEDPWRRGIDSVSNLPSTHSRLPTWSSYHRLAVTYTAGSPPVAVTASPEYTMYSYSLDNQPAFTRKRVPNCHGILSRANRGYVILQHSDVDHNPPGPFLHSFDSLIGPIVLVYWFLAASRSSLPVRLLRRPIRAISSAVPLATVS